MRARKVLGIIYRKLASNTTHCSVILRFYTSLVQPHLEYAAQVWNPHIAKDIHCIEMVQTFSLRICAKSYLESYETLLDLFQIPSQQNRRLFLSLCTFYSIKSKLIYFPCDSVLPPALSCLRSLNYNTHALRVPFAHCNGLKFSFFNTTISLWNNLPSEAITSVTASNSFSLNCKIATLVSVVASHTLLYYTVLTKQSLSQ